MFQVAVLFWRLRPASLGVISCAPVWAQTPMSCCRWADESGARWVTTICTRLFNRPLSIWCHAGPAGCLSTSKVSLLSSNGPMNPSNSRLKSLSNSIQRKTGPISGISSGCCSMRYTTIGCIEVVSVNRASLLFNRNPYKSIT